MEVILLERVGKLGQMGDVVRVKDGFARNFLLPRGKALARHRRQQKALRGMKAELAGQEPRDQRARPASSPASSTAKPTSSCGKQAKPGNCSARCRRATSPACSRPTAPRSAARRSCSMRRSRRSDNTRCRWRCTRRSKFQSPSPSRAAQDEAAAHCAGRRCDRAADGGGRGSGRGGCSRGSNVRARKAKTQQDAPEARLRRRTRRAEDGAGKAGQGSQGSKGQKRRLTRRPDAIRVFLAPRPAWRHRPRAHLLWCHSLSVPALIYPAASALRSAASGFFSAPFPSLGLGGRLFLCVGLGLFVALGRSLGCSPRAGGPRSIDLR